MTRKIARADWRTPNIIPLMPKSRLGLLPYRLPRFNGNETPFSFTDFLPTRSYFFAGRPKASRYPRFPPWRTAAKTNRKSTTLLHKCQRKWVPIALSMKEILRHQIQSPARKPIETMKISPAAMM